MVGERDLLKDEAEQVQRERRIQVSVEEIGHLHWRRFLLLWLLLAQSESSHPCWFCRHITQEVQQQVRKRFRDLGALQRQNHTAQLSQARKTRIRAWEMSEEW